MSAERLERAQETHGEVFALLRPLGVLALGVRTRRREAAQPGGAVAAHSAGFRKTMA